MKQLPVGTVVQVLSSGNGIYQAILPDGTDVTEQFEDHQLRRATKHTGALRLMEAKSGPQWRNVPMSEFKSQSRTAANFESGDDHDKILKAIRTSPASRPENYRMDDLKWKFAVRTILRGKNMLVTGPKGTGKTTLVFALAETLGRTLFNIPLGATQDPRSTLIGNTHFKQGEGTYLAESEFVRAIQTPNAIILLDELSRAHPDAWNILMPVLDYKQRFLRLDEAPGSPTVKVADGVSFISTANIGASYTATRTIDAAVLDRFIVIEVDYLSPEEEMELLKLRIPNMETDPMNRIVQIASDLRKEAKTGDQRLSDGLSTRSTLEMGELLYDGFSLREACDLVVFPQFSEAGGAESERTIAKQIVQKHLPAGESDNKDNPYENTDDDDLPWK